MPATKPRQVLFLSRIAPKKRLELLIDACALHYGTSEEFSVLVCGSGEAAYVRELKRRADGLPVEFVGHIDGEARRAAESASALLCLPSDNENFGQAVTEAMAAGLPVVTTATTGAAVHVLRADAGWIIERPDAESLGLMLIDALKSPSSLAEKSARAQVYSSKHLTWASVAANWTDCVTGMAAQGTETDRHLH